MLDVAYRRPARLASEAGFGDGRAMGRSAASIEDAPFGAVVPAPAGYLPPYVRTVIEEAAQAGLRPMSRPTRPHDPRTPALVAVVRDEAPRLPGFLAHYRRLGVTRFAIIDNGSRDATRALLAAAPDVALYAADRPFPGKQGWVNALIARMGYDRWYLTVDADERLVFDGAPAAGRPGRGLAELVRFAEAGGLRRLRAMLVDLYPPGPLLAPEAREPSLAPEARDPSSRRRRGTCCSTPTAMPRRSASSGSRARAGRGGAPSASTPSSASTRCSTSAPARSSRARTTCTPIARTTARTACSRSCTTSSAPAGAPAPSAPRPRATTGRRASSTGRRWRRSPAIPASRCPTPAAGATGRRRTSSPPG